MLYLCLSVDCPVLELFSETIRNGCNRIFLFDYEQYEQIRGENADNIFYLPLGANVARWDQVISGLLEKYPSVQQRYLYDVSFVGSLYTEKSPYQSLPLSAFDRGFGDGLIEAQLKLPGLSLIQEALTPSFLAALKKASPETFSAMPDAFQNIDAYIAANQLLGMRISELERIRTLNLLTGSFPVDLFTRSDSSCLTGVRVHGGVSTHLEMPEVFFRSKINLNITIRSIQTGLSQRVWDILGCRGFLLSNYQAEIPEYFTIGQDLDCFENAAELKEKIAYYLAHDERRQEIASRGYDTVKEKHTCLNRVLSMLQTVFTSSDP